MRSLLQIFFKWQSAAIALVVTLVAYGCFVIVPQYHLIFYFWGLPVTFMRKFYFVIVVGKGFLETVSIWNSLYVILVSLLLGLNVAAFVYFFRSIHGTLDKGAIGTGLGGGFFAMLGAGCASCGTFIATYVLGLIGGQSLLLWLPLGGMEFAIVGVVGLVVSFCLICNKIS